MTSSQVPSLSSSIFVNTSSRLPTSTFGPLSFLASSNLALYFAKRSCALSASACALALLFLLDASCTCTGVCTSQKRLWWDDAKNSCNDDQHSSSLEPLVRAALVCTVGMLNDTYLLSSFCILLLCSVRLGLCDLYLLVYSLKMSLVNCSTQVFLAQEHWSVSGRFCLDCQPFCLKHRDTCETWGLVSLVMQYLCMQKPIQQHTCAMHLATQTLPQVQLVKGVIGCA